MKKGIEAQTRKVILKKDEPFLISRAGIELFIECPCCFYLNYRMGIKRPPGFPFDLNKAVDLLLRKEFDVYRARKTTHPLMKQYGIDAVPFQHLSINEWRTDSKGIQYLHEPTNLLISGVVDDVWINKKKELIVVDYRATSQKGDVDVDSDWHWGYKRIIEVHQWLLRRLGFKVSKTGYFICCNGKTDRRAFNGRIEFDMRIIRHHGSDVWVEEIITEIKACLQSNNIPDVSDDCEFCSYAKARASKTVVFI